MSETPARYEVISNLSLAESEARALRLRAAHLSRQLDDVLAGRPVGVGIAADYLAIQLGQVNAAVTILEQRAQALRALSDAPPE